MSKFNHKLFHLKPFDLTKLSLNRKAFHPLGIKSRVILLGTIPAMLFAIILAGYAISNVFDVLNQSYSDRGHIIATHLAPAAEYGVISGNRPILQKLAQQVLVNDQEVRTVLILDKKGSVLAFSGRPLSQDLINRIQQDKTSEFRQQDQYRGQRNLSLCRIRWHVVFCK